jgi:hypothetical protein
MCGTDSDGAKKSGSRLPNGTLVGLGDDRLEVAVEAGPSSIGGDADSESSPETPHDESSRKNGTL